MSFDWSEYLTVAQELASQAITSTMHQGTIRAKLRHAINRAYYAAFRKARSRSSDEAKFRCAISRAYYAAFRKARNHLRDKEDRPINALTRGNTHQNVINLFNTGTNTDRLMVAQFLLDLRSARNRADYEDTVSNLPGLTTTVLLQAEQVLTLLKII
jgi:uncharacterized protein (UPF0332 family)